MIQTDFLQPLFKPRGFNAKRTFKATVGIYSRGYLVEPIISEEVRSTILSEITPTDEEIRRQASVISALRERLVANSSFPYLSIAPQGSTGKKQTQLRGASDIDLFVILSQDEYSKTLLLSSKKRRRAINSLMDSMVEDWFIPALKGLNPNSMRKTYSQHPYLSLEFEGFDVDVVSCFYVRPDDLIENGPITAVDRTIHHTEYVATHIENYRDDVRILKSFVRANHAYADRCAVGRMGFTGYSLELLVIHKLGVDSAIRAIMDLDLVSLDPFHRVEKELRKKPAFRDDHIFIMDPTDPWRNVASSFDERAFSILRAKAKQLIKFSKKQNSSLILDLLREKPIPITPVPEWFEKHCIVFEYESDGSSHYTILRDKLYRIALKIVKELKHEPTGEPRFGEALMELFFENRRYALGFLVENPSIEDTYERKGPPVSLREASSNFRAAHTNVYEKEGHLWANVARRWTVAEKLITSFLEESKIRGIKKSNTSRVAEKLLNIMKDYVLLAEPTFPALK
ncbi:MAG: hypothetical protein ACFFD6_00715 [Candidatus Thorarchaeota archaeon]